jgi:hypothetical protein
LKTGKIAYDSRQHIIKVKNLVIPGDEPDLSKIDRDPWVIYRRFINEGRDQCKKPVTGFTPLLHSGRQDKKNTLEALLHLLHWIPLSSEKEISMCILKRAK